MINLWRGVLYTLIGFENHRKDGNDVCFNFILSNGNRSTQRDKYHTYYDHMMPKDAIHKIRRVNINYTNRIRGFSFFDKDGAQLWKIGYIESFLRKETVVLAEKEVIVGVVAKLLPGWLSAYTDF